MRRAALYARVSTERQEKEETIESQLAAITRYADRQGLRHSPALTYTDDGYSGTWLDRPALDELRDHAREGRFDVVVVLCPDRLARRYAYQVLLLEELKRTGIEVLFCERPIGDSPDDQLLLQVQGAIAEYERAKMLERCRRGRQHRARQGVLAPPRTPYGYVYSARKYGGDGQIRIHEEEAAMVRQVFAWYAEEGATLYRVVKKLDASPWRSRSGKAWSRPTVLGILHCEWYVGRAYYGRRSHRVQPRSRDGTELPVPKTMRTAKPRSEWIEVQVPRIVDDGLFACVQERIQESRRFSKRCLKRKRVYLLRGLLKCGVCGYTYSGHTYTRRSKDERSVEHRYYGCRRTSPSAVPPEPCTNTRLLGAGVEEVVWKTVRDLLVDSDALARAISAWLLETTAESRGSERRKLATARLNDLRRQRERLIDEEALEDRTLTVEHELAELHSAESQRERAVRQAAGAQAVAAQLRDRLRNPDFDLKRAILRLAVEKVVVINHRLEIHLALPVSGNFDLILDWRARPTLQQNSWRFGLQLQRQSCQNRTNLGLSGRLPVALTTPHAPSMGRFGSLDLLAQRRAVVLNSAGVQRRVWPSSHRTHAF
jgi:site-specific DNA recombinase